MKKSKFYTLQWTWGIIVNLVGFLIYMVLTKILGCQSHPYGEATYVILPWELNCGFSAGLYIFISPKSEKVLPHEYGHSIQNAVYGPFNLIIVISSIVRFWSRRAQKAAGHPPKTGYYDIWFERQASEWGEFAINNFNQF